MQRYQMIWRTLTLFLAVSALAAEENLPDLGPGWFERLRDPETRLEALREWDLTGSELRGKKAQDADSAAAFDAEHRNIRVTRCPQPTLPDAWLVFWDSDYHGTKEMLAGPGPDAYPPTQAELKLREKTADIVWEPGEPWMESKSFFLTNELGETLSKEGYIGCGMITDFDGDGMLDLVEFETIWLTGETEKRYLDLVQIGPLDGNASRFHSWGTNLRATLFAHDREWRFEFRKRDNGAGLDLFLVSKATPDPFEPKPLEVAIQPGELPEFVVDIQAFGNDSNLALAAFVKKWFGWEECKVG